MMHYGNYNKVIGCLQQLLSNTECPSFLGARTASLLGTSSRFSVRDCARCGLQVR